MFADIISALGFFKDLRRELRRLPDAVGFSIVTYGDNDPERDHLRIVNLTPFTIHGFRCTLQKGPHDQAKPLQHVYHCSDADVYRKPVLYKILIPENGIYLRPNAWLYVPLAEAIDCKATDDLRLGFSYVTPEGRRMPGRLQHVVRVHAIDPRTICEHAQRKRPAPSPDTL